MDERTFELGIRRVRQKIRARYRLRVWLSAAVGTVLAGALLSFPAWQLGLPGWAPWAGAAAFATVGAVTLSARSPRSLRVLSRVLAAADRDTATRSADGSVTFVCPAGLFIGSAAKFVPFDDARRRVESVSWDEALGAFRFQVWSLVEMRNGDREVRETYEETPHPRLSNEEGLARAVGWNKLAWQVRHRGGPGEEAPPAAG